MSADELFNALPDHQKAMAMQHYLVLEYNKLYAEIYRQVNLLQSKLSVPRGYRRQGDLQPMISDFNAKVAPMLAKADDIAEKALSLEMSFEEPKDDLDPDSIPF